MSTCEIGCLSLYMAALRLTDHSFELPWGCAQVIPSTAKERLHRTMGFWLGSQTHTKEPTMVRRSNFHAGRIAVGGMAGAVSARAPSRSASATDLRIAYLPPERLRPSPNNARRHSKKQLICRSSGLAFSIPF